MSLKVSSRCIARFVVILSVIFSAVPIIPVSAQGCTNITTASALSSCITTASSLTLGGNITLAAELPDITSTIALNGNGYTISGDNSFPVFYVAASGNLSINQLTIQQGIATLGGGIANEGILTVTNSTFANNSASFGGAIYNFNSGTATITNSTFSANSATFGGGVANFSSSATITITNSTFSGNTATGTDSHGGGIFLNSGAIHMAGVLLDNGPSGENCWGNPVDHGYNLSDDDTCGFDESGASGSADNASLNLGGLSGGVHTPADPSDAIGVIPYGTTITNNTVSWTCDQTTTDQINQTRPINAGGACTSGAVEVESPVNYDFGDAPDPAYPTLLASNGARHIIGGALYLGGSVDSEPDGQPNADATGDGSDEDGVTFTTLLLAGETVNVTVIASGAGVLSAWIDFNGDGDWGDAGEQIFTDQALSSDVNNLSFTVPASAASGTTFARFRLDSGGGLAPIGLASDGEVEDYQVAISATGLTASKTAALQVDADGDTLPSAGDTLRYTVVVTNASAQDVTGVTFTDTPDTNTSLVTGAVTTTQGTVTSGNTPGDTNIAVDVGTIASGGSVTVAFDVTINDPLPDGVAQVSNQGLVTGSNFADTSTDDPNTAAANDATVTTLNFPAPAPVSDSSVSDSAAPCPNGILTALNFGADALPNGGGVACHVTPADRDFLLPVPPDGYRYAYQPRYDGYFDVFGMDQNGGSFGTLTGSMEICFAPATGLATRQVIARYGGYPVVGWEILPTYERSSGNSTQLCATTQPNTESLSHAYTLLTGAGLDALAAAPVNASSVPITAACDVTVNFRMNLRAEPGEQAAILTVVPYNVTLTANMQANGWYHVDYLGTTGWLSADFVTPGDGCSGLPIR